MRSLERISLLPLAVGCALLAVGCIPIPRTIGLSPAVTGTLKRADGTPLAGTGLVLSTADGDATCAVPALRATTDSAGRFDFPMIRKREPFTVVLFERLLCYRLCGGEQAADLNFRDCYLHYVPDSASVSCTEWETPGSGGAGRTSCVAERRRRR